MRENMQNSMKYLIDSDVLITAKNFAYRFEFCRGFWDWMIQAHQHGIVYSIDKVKSEILRGLAIDPLRQWVENELGHNFFSPSITDPAVMKNYAQLMSWSIGSGYTDGAKSVFAEPDRADAFLIATAKTHGSIIVTGETSEPKKLGTVKIPDAAKAFGVQTISIYDLLSSHAHQTFSVKH